VSGFDYDTSRYAKIRAIKQFLYVWAHAIDRLVRSDQQRHQGDGDARNWSLTPPDRSCNLTLYRRWAAGEQIVRQDANFFQSVKPKIFLNARYFKHYNFYDLKPTDPTTE